MRFSIAKTLAAIASLATFTSPVAADEILQSKSLNTCQENSAFTASLFNVVFMANISTAVVDIVAISSVQGNVTFDVHVSAYGYPIINQKVDPCDPAIGLAGLCPMTAGKIPLNFNLPVDPSALEQIPSIAYTFPDLDAKVKVIINMTDPQPGDDAQIACVEADISNGKTVDLAGVKWATAIVAGLALAASAVVSGLGHQNAASHVASNAMSLFGYFQAQAMLGLTGVPLPPVVMSWTQNLQWSMGIIQVPFMQDIFTWYQRATGGTPSTIFDSLTTVSVQVEKRSLDFAAATMSLAKRSLAMMPRAIVEPVSDMMKRELIKRGNIQTGSGSYIVYGIQRVAFRAGIETTNLFMTGLAFFIIFVFFTVVVVAAFKGYCELAVKHRWMKVDTFLEFRNGWFTILKGILFRVTLIGWPQIVILCLWEFTQNDSPAEIVLAIFFFFGMAATLGWAALKVVRIARRSVIMHRNPAYILFSDPLALNKWGFLYVQFRASAYYFIIPTLGYLLIKGMFIAFAQHKGTVQAVAFLIIEAGALIGASVMRPWMDKKTNSFNIAICVMNFLNSIFLLMFTEVFNQPPLVTGIVGLVLWVSNAAFMLVLLLMLIVSTVFVFFRENPDGRYQIMADDRTSFMKSQTHLNTASELDALAATARGDKSGFKGGLDLDDDAESLSSDTVRQRMGQRNSGSASIFGHSSPPYGAPPRSPVDPSMPLFPADGGNRSPPKFRDHSPSPYGGSNSNLAPSFRQQNNQSPAGFRRENNASPWQRGVGFEH